LCVLAHNNLRLCTVYANSRCTFTMQSFSPYESFVPTDSPISTTPSTIWKPSIRDDGFYALVRYNKHPFTTSQAAHLNLFMWYFKAFTLHKTAELIANIPHPQLSAMHTQPTYEVSGPTKGCVMRSSEGPSSSAHIARPKLQHLQGLSPQHLSHATSSQYDCMPGSSEGSSPQLPELQYLRDQSAHRGYHAASSEDETMPPGDVPYTFLFSRSSSIGSFSEDASPPTPAAANRGRYYSHALSEQDQEALTYGRQNHNMKAYTAKDVIMHHESRKELVPKCMSGMNRIAKMEAIADIEQARKDSQRALTQKVRDSPLLP
jgi:hypothetical protein